MFRIESDCQSQSASGAERRLEVVIAARDPCGSEYMNIEADWCDALEDLKELHREIRRDERNLLPETWPVRLAHEKADWIFGQRFHAAIDRWNDAIAADIEENDMATAATKKRSRAKSSGERIVQVRIEPRLKCNAQITIRESRQGWSWVVDASDQKCDAHLHDSGEGYDCEAAVLTLAFDRLWTWAEELRSKETQDRQRLTEVVEQIAAHARQVVSQWLPPESYEIPETAEQAAEQELTYDEWIARVAALTDLDMYRIRAGQVAADESLLQWYHEGFGPVPTARMIDDSIAGEMDLRDDEPSEGCEHQPTPCTPCAGEPESLASLRERLNYELVQAEAECSRAEKAFNASTERLRQIRERHARGIAAIETIEALQCEAIDPTPADDSHTADCSDSCDTESTQQVSGPTDAIRRVIADGKPRERSELITEAAKFLPDHTDPEEACRKALQRMVSKQQVSRDGEYVRKL